MSRRSWTLRERVARVMDYVRHDVREIVFPSSLPDVTKDESGARDDAGVQKRLNGKNNVEMDSSADTNDATEERRPLSFFEVKTLRFWSFDSLSMP